jgi:hypothetical protein
VGAVALTDCAADIETMLKQGQIEAARARLPEFSAMLDETLAAVALQRASG